MTDLLINWVKLNSLPKALSQAKRRGLAFALLSK